MKRAQATGRISARRSSPIMSATLRRGVKRRMHELLKECESLLIDALASYAIPRWRADGLNPVVPSADDGDAVVRPILARLASKGALPVLAWPEAAELAVKWTRGQRSRLRKAIRRLRYSKDTRPVSICRTDSNLGRGCSSPFTLAAMSTFGDAARPSCPQRHHSPVGGR